MADFNNFNNGDSGSFDSGNYNNGSYDGGNYSDGRGNYTFDNYDMGAGTTRTAYYGEETAAPTESLSAYTAKTYLWMFAGLMVTFVISLAMVFSGGVFNLLSGAGSLALFGVLIAQLVVVGILSARVRKLSVGGARAMFLLYAALNGVAFSVYFVYFNLSILILAFGATALLFGGMALASLVFHLQLDTIRPILFGGLIMMILFGILSFFLNLGVFNTVLCYVGIALFMGYTAYDTSKIKDNYNYYATIGDTAMLEKASVFSALQLYLDFVNLLLYIIRLFARSSGSRKN